MKLLIDDDLDDLHVCLMAKKKRKASAGAATTARNASAGCANSEDTAQLEPAQETSGESNHVQLQSPHQDMTDDGQASQEDIAAIAPAHQSNTVAPGQLHQAEQQQEQEQQNESPLTQAEATKVLERFFTVLFMANVAVHLALKPLCGSHDVTVDIIETALQQAGLPGSLVPIERRAFQAITTTAPVSQSDTLSNTSSDHLAARDSSSSSDIDIQQLVDQASAIAFRIEMCELQLRSAVLDAGTRGAAKARVDVQRIVARLTAAAQSPASTRITSSAFERVLEEKLGLTPGSFLVRVVFARIAGRAFARSFPRELEAERSAFTEALERFCVHRPLSLDSVEGQLRQLVTAHPDLRATFRALDVDGSGTISASEFVTFLQREAKMMYHEAVLTAFIKRFDVDGDGTLNYNEFVEFVRPKTFGVQVLSPFGMFYLALDRLERMRDVVEKIRTRLFWLQHNDLFAVASAASSATARARTQSAGSRTNGSASTAVAPTTKLKVTDRFVLTHHFGTMRLQYAPDDTVVSVLANGELVVLVLESDERSSDTARAGSARCAVAPPPPQFTYRLKPSTKRDVPLLFSTTAMLASEHDAQQDPYETKAASAARRTSTQTDAGARVRSSIRAASIASSSKARSIASASAMSDDAMI